MRIFKVCGYTSVDELNCFLFASLLSMGITLTNEQLLSFRVNITEPISEKLICPEIKQEFTKLISLCQNAEHVPIHLKDNFIVYLH